MGAISHNAVIPARCLGCSGLHYSKSTRVFHFTPFDFPLAADLGRRILAGLTDMLQEYLVLSATHAATVLSQGPDESASSA